MAEHRLPLGRARRFFELAGAGARAGASMLATKGSESAALHFAQTLGTLRGLAAKIGQTMSYVDGILPEAQRDAYERALGTLRAAAPSSSPEEIARVVEEELKAPIDRLFSEWEREPFASASIGQVHRARLFDGRLVAVKVQHPGIDRALESDLGNVSMFEGLVSAMGPRALDTKPIFEVVKKRFLEELNYGLEAEHQAFFKKFHAADPHIRVPAVIGERSARRVLTSDFIHGQTLETAAGSTLAMRKSYVRTLWRFVFKGNLLGGRFNADPHPGNYLFHEDGAITFLDFGCVQPIAESDLGPARAMHRAAVAQDDPHFREHARLLLGLKGGSYERAALDYTRRCFEPLFGSPFHISRDYVSGLVSAAREMKKEIFAKDKSFVSLPANMVFMNRLQFGFYSVLARLDAEADYAAEERAFLPFAE